MADDHDLFRAAVGKVTPLRHHNRVAPHRPPPKHYPASDSLIEKELPDKLSDCIDGDAPDEFLRNGYSRLMLRKACRTLVIQDRLDLHGYLVDAARKQLQQFLHDALYQELRCVLVIHGKGLNSRGGEAVLKRLTRHWLVQHHAVLAYCDAPLQAGGGGAVWVLLKSATRIPL